MAGDHACPVCQSRFTRPQHVTRHMRSHTGDRPYKCTHCGDQFARSDLLSRHVNKCHNGQGVTARGGRKSHTASTSTPTALQISPCDQCLAIRQTCDLRSPCGKCTSKNTKCTYSKDQPSRSLNHRASLPSLAAQQQQQQNDLLFGSPLGQSRYAYTETQSNDPRFDPRYTGVPGSEGTGSLGLPLPSLPPMGLTNSQYLHDEPIYGAPSHQPGSQVQGISGLPRGLGLALGPPQSGQQPYVFGTSGSPVPSAMPPLSQSARTSSSSTLNSLADEAYRSSAAAHLHYRRASLGLSGVGYPADTAAPSSQQYSSIFPSGRSDTAGYSSSTQPSSTTMSLNLRSSPAGPAGSLFEELRFSDPRRLNNFDDSNSEYGSSAPSPSMSYGSSRPTSSAGPTTAFGQQPSTSENYIQTMSGNAPPLPTPLQMNSFSSFPPQQSSDGTGQTQAPGTTAHQSGAGNDSTVYPPYQSLDNMTLEDQQAFATAAANNTSRYPTGITPFSSTLNAILGAREGGSGFDKDMWTNYISEPLTGGSTHGLSKMSSMPSLRTPMAPERYSNAAAGLNLETPRALYPNASQQLMLGASKESTDTNSKTTHPQSNDRSTSGETNHTHPSTTFEDNLRSYQEACLKRETPMLRLMMPRPKSRTISGGNGDWNRSSGSPPFQSSGITLPPIHQAMEAVQMQSGDTGNTQSESTRGHIPGGFAQPYPPTFKSSGDWNHRRTASSSAAYSGQGSESGVLSSETASRPSYKRLPSQTLGPEQSKKTRSGVPFPEGSDGSSSGSEHGSDVGAQRQPNTSYLPYKVSFPQAGYGSNQSAAQNAWMRQRSMSSPTTTRNFDWQSLDAGAR